MDSMIRIFGTHMPEEEVAANRHSERRKHHSWLDLLDDGVPEPFGSDVDRYRLPRFPPREGNACNVKSVLATMRKGRPDRHGRRL
jgi:hypothetical protein